MSPASIQFDDSLWPLLIIRFEGTTTIRQYEEYLARRTSYLERGERHVVILDLSRTSGLGPPEQRHLQVDWMKRHDAALRELVLGAAFVTDSAAVRLLISLVLHLKPLASPHVAVASVPEAVAWVADRLRQSGLEAEAHHLRTHRDLLPSRRSV
ncbi:STAS/SEC14 domain-containing protein [Vitiosangium sp. GDMCC 1.1324]|uniref:STAS/SEC14 domain-containing protein n=1 Tax=Vitiosangium sp. (strain GDMCC 1.1324) TaxID=2138576 RepID=UPI0011B7668A|nr:STAS/SEC14 domain-containing protein [Vitiosangium sp. GDMCC 1.1324]